MSGTRPATVRTGAGTSNLASSSSRGSNICIGLLVVAICLQLYVISLWLSPAATATSGTMASIRGATTNCPSRTSILDRTVNVLNGASADQTKLSDSETALTALHLLQKFIREHRGQLDSSDEETETDTIYQPHSAHSKKGKRSKKHDAHSEHEHHAGDSHPEEQLTPELYHSIWLNISAAWAEDQLAPEHYERLPAEEKKRLDQCDEYQKIGHVIPDESWGDLPEHLHGKFDALRCSDVVSVRETAHFIRDEHPELYNRVWAVPEDRQRVQAEPGMEDKVIAIIVAMTTRTITIKNFAEDLALFKNLFPSFKETLDPGFEYWFYLGYDKGDPWLDDAKHLDLVRAWFDENVAKDAKLREQGIVVKLVISTWENPFKRPGPAFNHVTGVAYADGATWIYRINDDQLFVTPWAKAFVDELTAMGPPYGVVGPTHHQGATHILVVDFVHRTHHEIFPTHYPPALMAWWMDNWVSQVYGRTRTKRVPSVVIKHLVESHSTRYPVKGFAKYCRGEIARGRAMFEEYLAHTPGMQKQLATYRADSFSYHTRR